MVQSRSRNRLQRTVQTRSSTRCFNHTLHTSEWFQHKPSSANQLPHRRKNFLVFFSEEDLANFFARSETDTITEYLEGPDFELTDDWLDLHIMDGPRLFRYLGYS